MDGWICSGMGFVTALFYTELGSTQAGRPAGTLLI